MQALSLHRVSGLSVAQSRRVARVIDADEPYKRGFLYMTFAVCAALATLIVVYGRMYLVAR